MIIVGAGLSGLIAAHIFPGATILEAGKEPRESHKALLRFRTDAVSKVTGIPFRKVRVRKGIWHNGAFVEPSINVANMYAIKCHGALVGDRSIWNLDASDRYIAPDDFYWQLVQQLGKRIQWNAAVHFSGRDPMRDSPMISTAPLHTMTDACMIDEGNACAFSRAKITVKRFRIPRCDVFQTVYFPTYEHMLYRASITGDTLICEFIGDATGHVWREDVRAAFALDSDAEEIDTVAQRYGKIAPIDDTLRKRMIARLTNEHGIYCLGRFATWRNILLDDVVEDAAVIKRLIHASPYERKLKQS